MCAPQHLQQGILKSAAVSPKPKERTRKLRFSTDEPQVKYGLTLEEYTDAELGYCWFAPFEYGQIKANNKILIKMHKAGTFPEDDKYCYRGLEFRSSQANQARRAARFNAVLDVIRVQNKNRASGKLDDEEIRVASESATAESRERALMLGRADAQTAAEILKDNDEELMALMKRIDALQIASKITSSKKALLVVASPRINKLSSLVSRTSAVHNATIARGLPSIVL
jgi:hypothetical protein